MGNGGGRLGRVKSLRTAGLLEAAFVLELVDGDVEGDVRVLVTFSAIHIGLCVLCVLRERTYYRDGLESSRRVMLDEGCC